MLTKNRWSSRASGATSATLRWCYKCYAEVGFTNGTVKRCCIWCKIMDINECEGKHDTSGGSNPEVKDGQVYKLCYDNYSCSPTHSLKSVGDSPIVSLTIYLQVTT